MSSKLKDARWQLAMDFAKEDHLDFFDLGYDAKDRYLYSAKLWLDSHGTQESIEHLAARFNKEDS